MSTAAQSRPEAHGSRTLVQEETAHEEAGPSHSPHHDSAPPPVGVLKLRGGPVRRQKVVWTEETIDNEGMGKKKSKICCIYHRPKRFDESSTESSSGSDDDDASDDDRERRAGNKDALKKKQNGGGEVDESSDSDGGQGDGRARPTKRPARRRHKHKHSHDCGDHDFKHVKPNKYDHQEKPTGSSGEAMNK